MGLEKLTKISERNRSRVILALDYPPTKVDVPDLLEVLSWGLCGVKLGIPYLLRQGLEGVGDLIEAFGESLYILADFKLADIPEIISLELSLLEDIGFDGAILHLFQGGVPRAVRKTGLDIIGIIAMSHPEARLFEDNLEYMCKEALAANVGGVIVGATKPGLIPKVRRLLGKEVAIITPGVGHQGAPAGYALREGADFEIVGRSIVCSIDPVEALESILEAETRALGEREVC